MAFKPVADLDASVTTAIGGVDKETGKKNPTSIEGYYIGTRQVPSRKSKSGFCSLHVLQTAKGNVGVWGKTNLDQKIPTVKPGQMVRITFTGMVETRNNPMYKYKLEIDADNTIEVSLPDETQPLAQGGEEEETYTTQEDPSPYVAEEEVPVEEELPPARAKAPAARPQAASPQRQAQVAALLGSKR